MNQKNPDRFYVYSHKKSDTGEIFYIGKGSGRRAFIRHGRSEYWNRIVTKHGFSVEIIHYGLSEKDAFRLEKEEIQKLTGLCNHTAGGEGISGYSHTEETRKRLSSAHSGRKQDPCVVAARAVKLRGKKRSQEIRNAIAERNRNRIVSDETPIKMSEARKGIKQSPDSIEKVAAWHRGKKRPPQARENMSRGHDYRKVKVLGVDNGMVFDSIELAEQWVRSNHNEKATRTGIWHCLSGRHIKSYGFTWERYGATKS